MCLPYGQSLRWRIFLYPRINALTQEIDAAIAEQEPSEDNFPSISGERGKRTRGLEKPDVEERDSRTRDVARYASPLIIITDGGNLLIDRASRRLLPVSQEERD